VWPPHPVARLIAVRATPPSPDAEDEYRFNATQSSKKSPPVHPKDKINLRCTHYLAWEEKISS
jgi:hypothetical protein